MTLLQRRRVAELVDDPDISPDELRRSLYDLELVNRWLGGRGSLMPYILPVVGNGSSIVDIGCGNGGILRWLSDYTAKTGFSLELVGVDLSPSVLQAAVELSTQHPDITYVLSDAPRLPFADSSFDVVFSSTLMHHLNPDEVVRTFSEAARVARRRVVISDLIRSAAGLAGMWFVGRIAFGRVSRHDGAVSFRSAYLPDDFSRFALQAGLCGARVYAHAFYRMTMVYG